MKRRSRDHDWRLQVQIDGGMSPLELFDELRHTLPEDIVLTHDNDTFFAYGTTEERARSARELLESILRQHDIAADTRVSHWEPQLAIWRQVEPPISDQQALAETRQAPKGSQHTGPRTERSVACVVGKLVRKSFEAEMLGFAASLKLTCEVIEHPHLLTTQVAFKVSGSPEDVQSFESNLRRGTQATMRLDPGLVPYGVP